MAFMSVTKASKPKPSRTKDDLAATDFVEEILRPKRFQRREWLVQRIGWVLIGLVLLAAALGVFGSGPLAKRMSANPALQIDYEWLTRNHSQTTWKLTPRAPPVDGRYRVVLDANWAQHFQVNAIQPQPSSSSLADGRWVYEFEARDARALQIVFHVETRKAGMLEGSIQLNDAAPLQVALFVYP